MRPLKLPHPDTFVAERDGMRLYAQLADVPLYAHVRLLAPGIFAPSSKRQSFRLNWVIDEQRLVNSWDKTTLEDYNADIVEWIREEIGKAYPDHATATGLSAAEVAELRAEQKAKRELRKKNK